MHEQTGYSRAQVTLHWLTAIVIFLAFITHDQMQTRPGAAPEGIWLGGTPLHVILGSLAFVLVLARLALRLRRGAPEPAEMPAWMAAAAQWGHRILYALMVLAPLAGMARHFAGIREMGELHEVLGQALMLLALAHALVALAHHFFLRDNTLRRMLRPGP